MGNIELLIQVDLCMFNTKLQIMDINPSYNYLLERGWIHMAGAVLSTFHQKIKFMVEEKLISVLVEEDMIAATTTTTPYIKVSDEAIECSFQSLEIVYASFLREGFRILTLYVEGNMNGVRVDNEEKSKS